MSSGREQRRSPRYRCVLDVELGRRGAKREHARSYDVSRHGLFVATRDPPGERFLVQLTINLPDGPLPATAFVSRRVPDRGAGLELFALSAQSKDRWDHFVASLGGLLPEPAPSPRPPERATFLIRMRNAARLRELFEKNVRSGGLYLATPVIKEAGAEIALVIIHPETEQELTLVGRVERVCREQPKGMEIKLLDARDAAFLEFIHTGQTPAIEAPVSSSKVRAEDSGDISLDIVVDESALEESEQFEWRNISQDLVIDLDVAEWEPEPASWEVYLTCGRCDAPPLGLRIGSAEGALGLVAEHRIYECTRCGAVKSALRIKPASERRRLAQVIDPDRPARAADLFAIAELGGLPRCAECGGNLKSTDASKGLEQVSAKLVRGESAGVEGLECPGCGEESLRVSRRLS